MATKVFISWSGNLSNKLADAVKQWLPSVLQFVKPYFTPSDIEKGAKWASDITNELASSDIGIICLTKDNLDEPWILFESGALSRNLNSRACTLLFGIDSTDLKGPLTTFQTTKFEKNDFKRLVKSINNIGGDNKLEDAILDQVFDMWWGKLETNINKIIKNHQSVEQSEHRNERDILEEILELSRLRVKSRSRGYGFSPSVLMDLAQLMPVLERIIKVEGSEKAYQVVQRMQKPMDYLFQQSDHPEIWERYRMMKNRNHHLFMEKDAEDDEKS